MNVLRLIESFDEFSSVVTLTQLAMFAHIRGGTVTFEVSIQVSAGASILAWLASAVIHIYTEIKHAVTSYSQT